jgi:hypothetical protein
MATPFNYRFAFRRFFKMCDICNSLFGHLASCPEASVSSSTYCDFCEMKIGHGEKMVTFPTGQTLCGDCVSSLDLSDLLFLANCENIFDLIEEFGIGDIETVGRL